MDTSEGGISSKYPAVFTLMEPMARPGANAVKFSPGVESNAP